MKEPQPIGELISSGRQIGGNEQSGAIKQNTGLINRIRGFLVNRIKPVKESAASRYSGLNTGQKVAVVGGAAITAAGAIAGAGIEYQGQLKSAIANAGNQGKEIVTAGQMLSQTAIQTATDTARDTRNAVIDFDNQTLKKELGESNPALDVQKRDAKMKTPQNPQGIVK